MEIFQWIFDLIFQQIFLFCTVQNFYIILSLVVLEALLSAENALVLGMMAGELPKRQQKKALIYGIWGAFGFRILAIMFAVQLINLWYVKLAGGAYLLYVAIEGLRRKEEEANRSFTERIFAKIFGNKGQGVLWLTIAQIELMDLAFSIDSIFAALGMVEGSGVITEHIKVIVIIGGILGIIIMRLAAMQVIKFIVKYPLFKKTAYVFVLIIGIKLIAGIVWHPPQWIFFGMMFAVLFGAIAISKYRKIKSLTKKP